MMENRAMVLTALRLPGNIEQRLTDIQSRLFAELGLLAARALPPLVPLAWTTSSEAPAGLTARRRIAPLTLGGLRAHGSSLVVALDPSGPVAELAAEAFRPETRVDPPRDSPRDIPFALEAPVVLLAPNVPTETAARATAASFAVSEREAVRGVVLRRLELVEIRIRAWHGEPPEHVVWQEVSRTPLRADPPRSTPSP
jgi:hypothetical protein